MKDINNIWSETLNILKEELQPVTFNTWIDNLKIAGLNENILYVLAPNSFNKEILENRYLKIIEKSVNKSTDQNLTVLFVLESDSLNFEENKKQPSINKEREFKNKFKNFEMKKLNPKYIFEEFVIGNSNRFAHAASLAVAESPAKAYNPLFIYGGVGLGKTHLMHAIGHYILKQNEDAKILYVSSENFTNDLINSIKDDKNDEFRQKYRHLDVLLVDDIQFIAGKERTQEEFFHTFEALHQSNKQIIISSDRPPKEIKTLEERLRSRFEWGLITDIQAPDFETRIAILQKKAEAEGKSQIIPNDVYDFVARKIKSNIRELEGALTRIIAYSTLTGKEISLSLSEEALQGLIDSSLPKKINVDFIKTVISRHFDVKIVEINSQRRTRNISYPRQVAMYLSRELTDLSLPKIGAEFGGRDHSTVLHAYDKISKDIKNNRETAEMIKKLKEDISN